MNYHWLRTIAAVTLAGIIAAALVVSLIRKGGSFPGPTLPLSYTSPPLDPDGVTILLLGDTSFGENYLALEKDQGRGNILKEKGYDYPLTHFETMLASADFVLANLETPVTDLRRSEFEGVKPYIHWTDSKLTPLHLAKNHVRSVSLGNNHTMDMGIRGLEDTIQALSLQGIEYAGAGLNQEEAESPLVWQVDRDGKSLKIVVFAGYHYLRHYDRRYKFYASGEAGGVNTFIDGRWQRQIRTIKKDDPFAFVICFPHWGHNYARTTRRQRSLAHAWIDAGADLIAGHGAHMAQEIENYKNRWIVYGLGNFMFNSPGRYEKLDVPPYSLMARVSLAVRPSSLPLDQVRLYPIFTDNKVTDYQGRYVDENEFESAVKLVVPGKYVHKYKWAGFGIDEFGRYVRLLRRRSIEAGSPGAGFSSIATPPRH